MEGKKKRGRPKGSKSRDYKIQTYEIPAVCPYCESASVATVAGAPAIVHDVPFVHPTAGPVDRIEKRRTTCNDCGRYFIKATLFPSKTNSPAI